MFWLLYEAIFRDSLTLYIFSSHETKSQVSFTDPTSSVVVRRRRRLYVNISKCYILNFFFRTTHHIFMKLHRNDQYLGLTKCCCFLGRSEIQDGRHDSHFEKPILNFFSSSTEWISMNLHRNVQ